MKKIFAFLLAALAVLACDDINILPDGGDLDQQVVSFQFSVNQSAGTKAKTDFENGDKVYVFFEGVANKYVELSFDGSVWTAVPSAEMKVVDFSGKNGKLNAIHFPKFVGDVAVSYTGDDYSFKDIAGNSIYAYYMSAADVEYTLSGTTLSATINVTKPDGFVQFFVPMSKDGDHCYRLLESHLQPKACASVGLDGTINVDESKPAGYVLKGYPASNDNGNGSKEGIMFSGYLSSTGTPTDYYFSLVTYISEEKPAALGTQVLTGTQTISSGVIMNLPNPSNAPWTAFDRFVDMGDGGPLWATGNLDKTHNRIAEPLQPGEYFQWGATTPDGSYYTGNDNPLPTSNDAAFQVNNDWRIPTIAQYETLIFNITSKWEKNWTSIGEKGGGALITSNYNGISLFIPAAGFYDKMNNHMQAEGIECDYWLSSPLDSEAADNFLFQEDYYHPGSVYFYDIAFLPRNFGLFIRPVKNVAPAPVNHTFDLSTVTSETSESDRTAKDGWIIKGTLGVNQQIFIADGATVTLKNVNINASSTWTSGEYAGITCLGDATIILKDGTTNTVNGFHKEYPGIYVPSGKTLVICGETAGTGSLTATSIGDGEGAGIGSGSKTTCGNIVIEGGVIAATSVSGAGIGAGRNGTCGTITINGGFVSAQSGMKAAAIGAGWFGTCDDISISGGNLTATGGEFAPAIGSGSGGKCGDITIYSTVTSVIATMGDGYSVTPESIGAGVSGTCGTVTIQDPSKVTQK